MKCPRGHCDGTAERIGDDNYVCIKCDWTGSKRDAQTIRNISW